MGKSKKTTTKMKNPGGPFLAAAVFCEGILEDMYGYLSVQRIIDGVNILISSLAPPGMPSNDQPVQVAQNILLIFRTGNSPGKHALKLVVEQPNGKRSTAMEKEIELSANANGGVHVKTNTIMKVFSSGVFWIDVILDGKRFTRMPINIDIKREEAQASPPKKA